MILLICKGSNKGSLILDFGFESDMYVFVGAYIGICIYAYRWDNEALSLREKFECNLFQGVVGQMNWGGIFISICRGGMEDKGITG